MDSLFQTPRIADRTPPREYRDAHIIPGMPVQVAIDAGKSAAGDDLVEPITDVRRATGEAKAASCAHLHSKNYTTMISLLSYRP